MRGISQAIPRRVAWFYGAGGLGCAAKGWPISSFLMLYYHEVLGLSAVAVSLVLLIVTICDAIFDPMIGHLSDQLRGRCGRRLPLMTASIVPVTISFVLLWNPPTASPALMLGFLAVCLLLLRFFDTLFELPHLALVAELTADPQARVRLLASRYFFEGVGGLAIAVLTYNVLLKENPDGSGGLLSPAGYPLFSVVVGMLILLPLSVCVTGLWPYARRLQAALPPTRSLRQQLDGIGAILRYRPIIVLALVTTLVLAGAGVGGALGLYSLLFIFQFTQAQITVLSMLFLAGMLMAALAPRLCGSLSPRKAAIALCWTYAAATAIPLLARLSGALDPGNPALFALVAFQGFICASALSMLTVMLLTMLASQTDHFGRQTGRRCEGMIVATNTFARKLAQGVGILIAGMILDGVSFPSAAGRHAVPGPVLDALIVTYLIVEILLFALCTILLRPRSRTAARYPGARKASC